MSWLAILALVVFAVIFRLTQVSGMVGKYSRRWGTRYTMVLCGISAACAGLAIYISRH